MSPASSSLPIKLPSAVAQYDDAAHAWDEGIPATRLRLLDALDDPSLRGPLAALLLETAQPDLDRWLHNVPASVHTQAHEVLDAVRRLVAADAPDPAEARRWIEAPDRARDAGTLAKVHPADLSNHRALARVLDVVRSVVVVRTAPGLAPLVRELHSVAAALSAIVPHFRSGAFLRRFDDELRRCPPEGLDRFV